MGGCLTAPPVEGLPKLDWESRRVFVRAPWHTLPEVYIEPRELAVKSHDRYVEIGLYERLMLVYTDSSGYEGKIGAAAIDN